MTARISQPVLLLLAFAYSPCSSAQTGPAIPVPGTSHEEVIQLELTPADLAAVAIHRRVHTSGALSPDGGRYTTKTFETDSTGALVEVKRSLSSLAGTGQTTTALLSSGAPPFLGPGFYPADLSLASNTGQTITQAQVHNIYINCTAACWGYPGVFETNLFSSRFTHVLDQYVGSDENGRYTLGPTLVINNYPIPNVLITNPVVNFADLDAILHAAALKFGSGYGHIYNIFLPKGVDFCDGYAPPYTSCFSPDQNSTWTFCAEHGADSFSDIPGFEYATVQPYPDVFSVVNGAPLYACDVGQPPPYNSNTNPTPNGVLVDTVSNFIAHELFETITDPDGTEWQALNGYFFFTPGVEIGDVCEFTYGTEIFTPFYISGRLYEVQPMYSNKYHACVSVP